ncbi:MAG TPA: tectonin domain-containing protein [Thermoanaerobaculia bacterium]|jgi:hypothetical protein|nr:tectonin domain-containing protein [Thermoanaerobaculia bacterium]
MANIFRFQTASFQQIPGQLKKIAVGDEKNVWGINDQGKIYWFNPVTDNFEVKAAGQTLKHIAVGSGVWGIDALGDPYKWDGTKFQKVGGKVSYIGVPLSKGNPWARFGNAILRYNPVSKAFEGVPSNFKFLGVGDDDTQVWALDNDGWPWMWNGQKFVRHGDESLRLNFIAPGKNNVYGISLSSRTYRTAQLTGFVQPYFEDGLISTSGRLVYIDTGDIEVFGQGTSGETEMVWGLNSAGQAYQLESGWKYRGGPFSVLAVGIGSIKQGLAGDGITTVWINKLNVWALG